MDYYDQVRPEKRATNILVITSLDYGLHQNTMSIYVWTLKEQVAFQNDEASLGHIILIPGQKVFSLSP
jgi:hypothetical protein